jgi:hypothetical protein
MAIRDTVLNRRTHCQTPRSSSLDRITGTTVFAGSFPPDIKLGETFSMFSVSGLLVSIVAMDKKGAERMDQLEMAIDNERSLVLVYALKRISTRPPDKFSSAR